MSLHHRHQKIDFRWNWRRSLRRRDAYVLRNKIVRVLERDGGG